MRTTTLLLAVCLCAAPAVAAQTAAPAPPPSAPAPNPFQGLFTPWQGTNREALEAETRAPQPVPDAPPEGAIPAGSPLTPRARAEAVALGERVGVLVRSGDCAEGERIAREARDFALVRAVREHCAR